MSKAISINVIRDFIGKNVTLNTWCEGKLDRIDDKYAYVVGKYGEEKIELNSIISIGSGWVSLG